jgi:hypothetical protein
LGISPSTWCAGI